MNMHEIISSTTIGASAVLITLLERKFPYTPNQRLFRKHFLTDWLWFSIAFSYIMGWVIFKWIIPGIDAATHLTRLKLVSDWPLWLQMTFFIVTHDLWIYWFHRWMHKSKYLWRIHEAHHSAREVDWAAGSRAHVIEAVITGTVEWAPLVLLGAAPEIAIYKGMIDAIWGMYIHSNINVRAGWLQYVINGPEMHRWHHSRDVHDINYSTKLAIWDWMWRTAHLPPRQKPARYGIEIEWPRNLWTQQAIAFRSFESVAADTGANASAAEASREARVTQSGEPAPGISSSMR